MLGLDRKAAKYAWTVVCVLLVAGLVYRIRETLFIFVVALLFAYLLWPLVKLLDHRLPGKSRVPALALVYLTLVGVLIVVGIAVGSRVVQQANALAAKLPELLTEVHPPGASEVLPADTSEKAKIITTVQHQLAQHSRELLGLLPKAALGIVTRAGSLIFIVLVPILSFFILKDGRNIRDSVLASLAEGSRRDTVERIVMDVHVLLALYMRALVLLGLVASITYGIFFTIIGIPYGILLAAVDFPLEFIPMVGPLAGASIVLLVAGLSGSSHLLLLFVFLVGFRFFQDYVISPHLLSSGMKMHPLLVIFGVLAGGSIAGVAGSFLSVPVLAILRIVYRQLVLKSPGSVITPDQVGTKDETTALN